MGLIHNSIGLRWERVLQEKYHDLHSTNGEKNVPDFYHSSEFWIEAKAGNIRWGPRIKEYQLDQIKSLREPIVYALGMHTLDNARIRICQKTEWGRQGYLKKNMDFVEIYFVSGEIINLIFEREKRVDKDGEIYCSPKPSILRNIIFDRVFSRHKEKIFSSANYYGFDRNNYYIEMQNNIGYIINLNMENIINFLKL